MTTNARGPDPLFFCPPPGWPSPPIDWVPQDGWLPDASWPAPPLGWEFWRTTPSDSAAAAAPRMWEPAPPPAFVRGDGPPPAPMGPVIVHSVHGWRQAVGWGGLVLLVLLGGLTTGFSGGVIFASLYAAVVAIVGLLRARVRWAFLGRRRHAGLALGAATIGLVAGAALAAPAPASMPIAARIVASTTSTTAASTGVTTPPISTTASTSTTTSRPPTVTPSSTSSPAKAVSGAVGGGAAATVRVPIKVPPVPGPAATRAPAPAPPAPPAAPAPPAPRPPPPPPPPPANPVLHGVHPGAFCAPQGALGLTSTGKGMVCRTSATDSRNRWRST